MKQHIDFPTHTCRNILDKIITRTNNTIASNFEQSILFSDHYAITFLIHSSKPSQAKKNISYRKLSSIDMDKFKVSVANSLSNSTGIHSIETLNCSLSEQLNIFAPLKSLNITERYKHEWYDEECSNNRRHLRSFERKYRKSNTIKNLTSFRQLQCQHNHLLQKNIQLQPSIDAGRDQKKLFKPANDLLGRNCKNQLPNNETDLNCAQNFSSFFNSKINIIINSLPHCFTTPHSLYDNTYLFETFIPPTTDLIIKLIKSSKSTSLNDPLPISILHQLARLIAPHPQSIICRSLLTASFPDSMKNAIITPKIKNIKSDPNDLKNYRPISQLQIFQKFSNAALAIK